MFLAAVLRHAIHNIFLPDAVLREASHKIFLLVAAVQQASQQVFLLAAALQQPSQQIFLLAVELQQAGKKVFRPTTRLQETYNQQITRPEQHKMFAKLIITMLQPQRLKTLREPTWKSYMGRMINKRFL